MTTAASPRVVCDRCRHPCAFDPRVAIVVRKAGGSIVCERHPPPKEWTIRRGGVHAIIPGRTRRDPAVHRSQGATP